MLDGAFTSPKIRRLAVVLGVPWPHALGLAGLLWRFAAKHAPTGEIGLHDDEEIAAALEWPGDAGELVAALVRCRLLDPTDSAARLLVHDWPDHAPRYVSATLKRQKMRFSTEYSQNAHDMTSMSRRATTTVPTVVPTTVTTTDATTDGTTYTSSSSSSGSGCASAEIRALHTINESARALVSIQTNEDPVSGVSPVWMDEESSGARNASGGILRPLAKTLEKLAESVWEAYLPGRKTGRKPAIAEIVKSIHKVSKRDRLSPTDSAAKIRQAVEADVARMIERIRTGETEIKFCPQGVTYFRQERWNDDDQGPTDHDVRDARIDDEIRRARADLG
jgi:hypothetical protein